MWWIITEKQSAIRKYNRESQSSLDNQGYFSEKGTFAPRFKVQEGTCSPGSKKKWQRSPEAGKKTVTTGQGTKKSIWQELSDHAGKNTSEWRER